jgi:hypothetical protein
MSLPAHPTAKLSPSNDLPTAEAVELQALGIEYLVRAVVINQLRGGTRPSVRSVSQVLRERYGRASSDATITPLLRDIYREIGLLLAQPAVLLAREVPHQVAAAASFFAQEVWAKAKDEADASATRVFLQQPVHKDELTGMTREAVETLAARTILLETSLHESERKRLAGSLRLQRARRFVRNVRPAHKADGDKRE